jgi:hypothetical protein
MAAPFFRSLCTYAALCTYREVTARKYPIIGSLSAAGDRPLNPVAMQRLSFDRVTPGRRDLARPAATEHGTPRPIELFSQELTEAIQLCGFALGRPHALNRRSRHRDRLQFAALFPATIERGLQGIAIGGYPTVRVSRPFVRIDRAPNWERSTEPPSNRPSRQWRERHRGQRR